MQAERHHLRDALEDLAERTGVVDVLKDAASPLFEIGQRRGFPSNAPFDGQASETDGDDDQKQQADNQDQVAHIQPGRPRDDCDVVDVAHEDIKGYFAVEGVRVFQHADTGDADARADGNLAHGFERDWACCAWMADDGGEQVTVGVEHILVLGGLTHFGYHLALH